LLGGGKGGRKLRLTTLKLSGADLLKFGSLNIVQPSEPVQTSARDCFTDMDIKRYLDKIKLEWFNEINPYKHYIYIWRRGYYRDTPEITGR